MGLELSFSADPSGTTKVAILPESMLPTGQQTIKYDRIILAKRSSHRILSSCSDWIQYESSVMMKGHTMTEFRLLCYLKKLAKANTSSSDKTTTRIADGLPYDASLGLLRLQISGQSIEFPSADSWITQGENISWSSKNERIRTVSLKITWKLKAGSSQAFVAYNIYVERVSNDINEQDFSTDSTVEFLATTKAGVYYISSLEVPSCVTNLNFVIQVCAVDGTSQDLDKCPRYQLAVEGAGFVH